jgi:hypothetical protein
LVRFPTYRADLHVGQNRSSACLRGITMLTEPLKGIWKFELKSWKKRDLAAVQILPYFASEIVGDNRAFSVPVRFDSWMDTKPVQPLPASHPRCAAVAPPLPQADPITLGRYIDERLVLIDGYHRAGAFWRSTDPDARVLAYVPM